MSFIIKPKKAVGVHAAVGRQGIGLGDDVKGLGDGVVFEPDGHVRILLLRGVGALPRAAHPVQGLGHPRLLRGRKPALQEECPLRGHEPPRRILPGNVLPHPVDAQLQGLPPLRLGGQLLPSRSQLLLQPGGGTVDGGQIGRCRAAPLLQGSPGEAEFLQILQHAPLGLGMADCQQAPLVAVPARPVKLAQLGHIGQSGLHRFRVPPGGDAAEEVDRRPGVLYVQGHVQRRPGLQSPALALQPSQLGLGGLHTLLRRGDGLRRGPGRLRRLAAVQFRLRHLGQGGQQTALLLYVLIQGAQSAAQPLRLSPARPQRAVLSPRQRRPGFVLRALLRLRHLHTAQLLEFSKQRLLLARQTHQPKALHFDDGHVRCSQPFSQ